MKFEQLVQFYKLNDDGTVTVKCGEDYFRLKARLNVILEVNSKVVSEELKEGDSINIECGLGYVKGQGLVLQLISII